MYKIYGTTASYRRRKRIVEVDESNCVKLQNNRDHHVEGVQVVGVVERKFPRRIVLLLVEQRGSNTLMSVLNRFVYRSQSYIRMVGGDILMQKANSQNTEFSTIGITLSITSLEYTQIQSKLVGLLIIAPFRYKLHIMLKYNYIFYVKINSAKRHQ